MYFYKLSDNFIISFSENIFIIYSYKSSLKFLQDIFFQFFTIKLLRSIGT